MKIFVQTLVIMVFLLCIFQSLSNKPFVPIHFEKEVVVVSGLTQLNVPTRSIQEISRGIRLASQHTSLKENLIVALMYTESTFQPNSTSKKGYKGLMQSSKKAFEFTSVDILNGAEKLNQRLKETDGNLLGALARYKGGNKGEKIPQAVRQAKEVIRVYEKLGD